MSELPNVSDLFVQEAGRCPACGGTGSKRTFDGARMARLRQAAGLSLRELGKRLDLSPSYLCDVELGRRGIAEDNVERFISILRGDS